MTDFRETLIEAQRARILELESQLATCEKEAVLMRRLYTRQHWQPACIDDLSRFWRDLLDDTVARINKKTEREARKAEKLAQSIVIIPNYTECLHSTGICYSTDPHRVHRECWQAYAESRMFGHTL